ncbi:MAG TPA: hemolysin family protein [Firmicutes bacterium]|nr:hemolysin family protein [Bacillota bacterium]
MIFILLVFTGFFVATEFAIVKVRTSRIEQLVQEGKKGATAAQRVVTHLDEYLSACQLGITITALGLGWIAEPTVDHALRPLIEYFGLPSAATHAISFVLSFTIVTYLHVVLGELAPKSFAIQKAEQITLLFAPAIIWFYRLMFPFIWLLNGSARLIVSWFGIRSASEHEEAHTEEEIQILLDDSLKQGEINSVEHRYVKNIFEFDETVAKDIMVPRRDMTVLDVKQDIASVMALAEEEGYTRYPVIDQDIDNVIGFINVKDIAFDFVKNKNMDGLSLSKYIRPIVFEHESTPIKIVLQQLRLKRVQMAIVTDNYGGTSGLLTIEDIVEEIVGEIRDEFDEDEIDDIRYISDTEIILSGKASIEDINKALNTSIDFEEVDTINGWILSHQIPLEVNTSFEIEDYVFILKEVDRRYVGSILVKKKEKAEALDSSEEND